MKTWFKWLALRTIQSRCQSFDRISYCTDDRIVWVAHKHLDLCMDDFGLCFFPNNVAKNVIPIWLDMENLWKYWSKNISRWWFASNRENLEHVQFQTWNKSMNNILWIPKCASDKISYNTTYAGSTIKRSPLTNKNCDKLKYWSHRSK